MALVIWLASGAVAAACLFLADWGPLAFLRFVSTIGPHTIVIVLAFISPFWVLGGLIVLISLDSNQAEGRRSTPPSDTLGDSGSPTASQGVDWRARRLLQPFLRWCKSVEWSIAGWFVLRPVRSRNRTDALTTDGNVVPNDAYLQLYVRTWAVQALALFGMLILMSAISALAFAPKYRTESSDQIVRPALLAFTIALCVCNVAAVRYAVTRKVLKGLTAMGNDDTRLDGDQ